MEVITKKATKVQKFIKVTKMQKYKKCPNVSTTKRYKKLTEKNTLNLKKYQKHKKYHLSLNVPNTQKGDKKTESLK